MLNVMTVINAGNVKNGIVHKKWRNFFRHSVFRHVFCNLLTATSSLSSYFKFPGHLASILPDLHNVHAVVQPGSIQSV
jgi:hypothetical protein